MKEWRNVCSISGNRFGRLIHRQKSIPSKTQGFDGGPVHSAICSTEGATFAVAHMEENLVFNMASN